MILYPNIFSSKEELGAKKSIINKEEDVYTHEVVNKEGKILHKKHNRSGNSPKHIQRLQQWNKHQRNKQKIQPKKRNDKIHTKKHNIHR